MNLCLPTGSSDIFSPRSGEPWLDATTYFATCDTERTMTFVT